MTRAICILLSDRIIFQNSESAATIKILESKVQIGDERKVRIRCLQRNLELVLLLLLIFNTLKSLNILHVQFIFYYSKQAFESTLKIACKIDNFRSANNLRFASVVGESSRRKTRWKGCAIWTRTFRKSWICHLGHHSRWRMTPYCKFNNICTKTVQWNSLDQGSNKFTFKLSNFFVPNAN